MSDITEEYLSENNLTLVVEENSNPLQMHRTSDLHTTHTMLSLVSLLKGQHL